MEFTNKKLGFSHPFVCREHYRESLKAVGREIFQEPQSGQGGVRPSMRKSSGSLIVVRFPGQYLRRRVMAKGWHLRFGWGRDRCQPRRSFCLQAAPQTPPRYPDDGGHSKSSAGRINSASLLPADPNG